MLSAITTSQTLRCITIATCCLRKHRHNLYSYAREFFATVLILPPISAIAGIVAFRPDLAFTHYTKKIPTGNSQYGRQRGARSAAAAHASHKGGLMPITQQRFAVIRSCLPMLGMRTRRIQ